MNTKNRKKKVILLILAIGVLTVSSLIVLQKSQSVIETSNKEINDSGLIAMYIEDDSGEYISSTSNEFPKDGYILNTEKSYCKNGGVLSQDETTKAISLSTSHQDSCTLYFDVEQCQKSSLYSTITLSNGLKVYDESATMYNECNSAEMYTFDHDEAEQTTGWSVEERRDYRYIGSNPNNWIKFNDEDWRIIGVFTVEKEDGSKEQLIKIIRNKSIGGILWDDATDGSVSNEWSTASLKILLNGEYYNTGSSFSYTYKEDLTFAETTITIPKGLNEKARNQIENVKWYLGGPIIYGGLGAPDYYSSERGTTTYQNSGTTSIMQKVGLMYPSDYVYTYANGVNEKCYTDGYYCYTGTPSAGWLFNSDDQWAQSPYTNFTRFVTYVDFSGSVGNSSDNDFGVRPVVYLRSDIKIIGGDGSSSENAYILE